MTGLRKHEQGSEKIKQQPLSSLVITLQKSVCVQEGRRSR